MNVARRALIDVGVEAAAQAAVRGDDEEQRLAARLRRAPLVEQRVRRRIDPRRQAVQHAQHLRSRTGRACWMRSCARRSLDAATIFIAFVICCVDLTARMRRRMSSSDGIAFDQATDGLACAAANCLPNSSSAWFSSALIVVVDRLLFGERLTAAAPCACRGTCTAPVS